MPDFSEPVYASYIKLCRELGMKRPLHEMPPPFDSYQEFAGWDQLEAGGIVYSYGLAQDFSASVIHEDADPIWLPTLADWLEMLEEVAGLDHVTFFRNTGAAWGRWTLRSYRKDVTSVLWDNEGVTREEAAARLWIAVKP